MLDILVVHVAHFNTFLFSSSLHELRAQFCGTISGLQLTFDWGPFPLMTGIPCWIWNVVKQPCTAHHQRGSLPGLWRKRPPQQVSKRVKRTSTQSGLDQFTDCLMCSMLLLFAQCCLWLKSKLLLLARRCWLVVMVADSEASLHTPYASTNFKCVYAFCLHYTSMWLIKHN